MTTVSTTALMKQFVAAILAFVPASPLPPGQSVGALTVNRVYIGRPPKGTLYPFVVLTLQGYQTDPNQNNERATGTLEAIVYARDRDKAEAADDIADRIMQCFAFYRATGGALVFGTGVVRQNLPAFSEPADEEVVAVRLACAFACWPLLLLGG